MNSVYACTPVLMLYWNIVTASYYPVSMISCVCILWNALLVQFNPQYSEPHGERTCSPRAPHGLNYQAVVASNTNPPLQRALTCTGRAECWIWLIPYTQL